MPLPDPAPAALHTVADEVLVERAVDGDTVAFALLVRRHSALLRAYTSRIVGSLADADDIVQETFVAAWEQLPTLRDGSSFKAWVMRIGTRRALQHTARRPRETPLADDRATAPGADPEASAIRSAQLSALSVALDRLPDDQRRCWLLREVGDLGYRQIAIETGATEAQVRGRLARARASLAIQMEGWR